MNHIYPATDLSLDVAEANRITAASPSRLEIWPAFTTQTPCDVIVAAISLTRLVDWCGTPCVHTSDAVEPGTDGRPSETRTATVVVTRILALEWRSDFTLHVQVDADLSLTACAIEEARVIGRDIDPSPASVIIEADSESIGFATTLPARIEVGDLVAIPCPDIVRLHDVRRPVAS